MAVLAGFAIFYIIAIILCFTGPLWLRFFLFLGNFFMPDPVPLADELVMAAGVMSKIKMIIRAYGVLRCIVKIMTAILVVAVMDFILQKIFN